MQEVYWLEEHPTKGTQIWKSRVPDLPQPLCRLSQLTLSAALRSDTTETIRG